MDHNTTTSFARRARLVTWLESRVGLPIAMWGATGTSSRLVRFVDGARLEVCAPVEATNLVLARLRDGLTTSIERVVAVPDGIEVVLTDADQPFVLSLAAVQYDPSTGATGECWLSAPGPCCAASR